MSMEVEDTCINSVLLESMYLRLENNLVFDSNTIINNFSFLRIVSLAFIGCI